jgi:hypothetical protein
MKSIVDGVANSAPGYGLDPTARAWSENRQRMFALNRPPLEAIAPEESRSRSSALNRTTYRFTEGAFAAIIIECLSI